MQLYQDVPMDGSLVVDIDESGPKAARSVISNELIASQICVQALQQGELEIVGQKLLLASLARTCQALYVPALKEIWKSLDTLIHLVMVMPDDCWEIVDVEVEGRHKKIIRFTRSITLADSDRFRFHAKFVRSYQTGHPGPEEDSGIYEALYAMTKSCGDTSILPNLEKLNWTGKSSSSSLPFFTTFLHPYLSSIEISLGDGKALQTLTTISPNLRVVTLHTFSKEARADITELSTAFASLRSLTSLRTHTLTTEAYIQMAEHPTLEELIVDHLSTVDWRVVESRRRELPSFLRLRNIQVTGPDLDIILRMFQTMHQSPLHKITLGISTKQFVTTWDRLIQLFQARETYRGLSSLVFIDWDFADSNPIGEDPLLPEHLEPLLSFKHLVNVDLRLHCCIALDDDFTRKLAESWPELKTLRIRCQEKDIEANTPSEITLGSLVHLATNCPSLERLTLAFDAQSAELPEYALGNSASSQLSQLKVAFSPIDNPAMVAAILSDWFPRLEIITWEDRLPESIQEDWQRVRDMLPLLRAVRLQERRTAGRE